MHSHLQNEIYHAHTLEDAPPSQWEPLFTSFGQTNTNDSDNACVSKNGTYCPYCEHLANHHGHLNKVAYLSARFATEMLPLNNPDREALGLWGYLAGLWHDLGKFSEEFQNYITKAGDIHRDEVLEKVDHTTAGAKLAVSKPPLGHCLASAIAGHHSGLLDARHETRASLIKRLFTHY